MAIKLHNYEYQKYFNSRPDTARINGMQWWRKTAASYSFNI